MVCMHVRDEFPDRDWRLSVWRGPAPDPKHAPDIARAQVMVGIRGRKGNGGPARCGHHVDVDPLVHARKAPGRAVLCGVGVVHEVQEAFGVGRCTRPDLGVLRGRQNIFPRFSPKAFL